MRAVHKPALGGWLSSYRRSNLAGMTKRRTSSPYPNPPTGFVRALMRVGWRRCDAEAIDIVRLALTHAREPAGARTWAVRAAKALATEPVLFGAIHQLAD